MDSKTKLRKAGLRPTKQRIAIADILFNGINRHFTAENLHNDIIQSGKQMSLATIYNCLNKFKNVGLISHLQSLGETYVFDTNVEHHHHFFNEKTGELIDFRPGDIHVKKFPKLPKGYKSSGIDIIIKLIEKN